MGLGFLFDSTLGYPGEGPSHSPNTRRGFRPSLRLWSSKRSSPTLVGSSLSSLDVPGQQPPSKIAHGNSDTSLGRWLHAARTSQSHRDHIGEPSSGLRVKSHRPKPVMKLTPSSEFHQQAIPTGMGRAGPRYDDSSRPAPDSSTPEPQIHSAARVVGVIHPQLLPPNDAVVAPSSSVRREFIAKFASLHGVNQASLEAIWRSNKHGYNRAHDAPFERFQKFFQESKPLTSFAPEHILPGDLVSFLQHMQESGASFASLKDASASISMACREATDGDMALGDKESVKRFLKSVRIHEPAGPRKQRVPSYHDVTALFQEAWDFGPNECLCEGNLKEKLIILLMVDSAARPSDIHRLFRTTQGRNAQIRFEGNDMFIRYFWSKEVDPGSSRSNSTNVYFSKWVKIHGTVPKCTDTVETMKVFLRRTSDPELYATVFIPELQISSQPLVYARWQHGKLQQASVDHISNIVKRAISEKKMGRMMTAHIRGASVSKIVQLVPDLTDQALALGRWTTPHTFRNHYQAPVLGTWAKVPKSVSNNPQQVLRWGWTPQPPAGISVAEYEKPPAYWVGKTIPNLGKVTTFENGDYMVNDLALKHWEFMNLVSETRSDLFTV